MKNYKCPHCKREREKGDEIMIVECLCGEFMEEFQPREKNERRKNTI